jgi:hypothetical protein
MYIQANLGYYVASELRFLLPQAYSVGKSVRVAVSTGAAVPLCIGKHLSILEHKVTIRNKIIWKGFILNLQKFPCTVL